MDGDSDRNRNLAFYFSGQLPDFSSNIALEDLSLLRNYFTGTSNLDGHRAELICVLGTLPSFVGAGALRTIWLGENDIGGGWCCIHIYILMATDQS